MTLAAVTKTVRAEVDLDAIWFHIALENPTAADALLDAIDRRCGQLARHPMMGRARPELASGLRSIGVGRYVIFYVVAGAAVEIVRVLHGARDLDAIADHDGFTS